MHATHGRMTAAVDFVSGDAVDLSVAELTPVFVEDDNEVLLNVRTMTLGRAADLQGSSRRCSSRYGRGGQGRSQEDTIQQGGNRKRRARVGKPVARILGVDACRARTTKRTL